MFHVRTGTDGRTVVAEARTLVGALQHCGRLATQNNEILQIDQIDGTLYEVYTDTCYWLVGTPAAIDAHLRED